MSEFIDFAEKEMSKKLGKKITIGATHDSSWDEAPDWARWKAQSADGTWEWFSTKPKGYNFGLYVSGTFMASGKGKKEVIGLDGKTHYTTRPNPEWRGTVSKRPPNPTKGEQLDD